MLDTLTNYDQLWPTHIINLPEPFEPFLNPSPVITSHHQSSPVITSHHQSPVITASSWGVRTEASGQLRLEVHPTAPGLSARHVPSCWSQPGVQSQIDGWTMLNNVEQCWTTIQYTTINDEQVQWRMTKWELTWWAELSCSSFAMRFFHSCIRYQRKNKGKQWQKSKWCIFLLT